MVLITILNGVYKPTYNWGGPTLWWFQVCFLSITTMTITVLSDDNDADQTASTGEKERNGMILIFIYFHLVGANFWWLNHQSGLILGPCDLQIEAKGSKKRGARTDRLGVPSKSCWFHSKDGPSTWVIWRGFLKSRNFPKQNPARTSENVRSRQMTYW